MTSRTASGTNGLIRDGAPLVRDAVDVLDLLADVTGTPYPAPDAAGAGAPRARPSGLDPALHSLLDRIEAGSGSLAELAGGGRDAREVLVALGRLEAAGLVRRAFGGRYERAM